jgi:peptide/nickel transport system ATP-binding protein
VEGSPVIRDGLPSQELGLEPLVAISGLTVAFRGAVALHGIDLTVQAGESVGLVGESGCGKSVTWLAALGLLPASAAVGGSVTIDGTELLGARPAVLDRVRGGRVAMIFQDPASALNPVHRIGRQVAEAVSLHRGLSGSAAKAEALRLLDQVGIPGARARMAAYPHEMSGGQNQRVMIAAAVAGRPELLIADEPTTALDVTIQAQILDLLARLRDETGMALVLISHDLGVVADVCDRVCVMYAGRIVEEAPARVLFDRPAHPYAAGLLGALPPIAGKRRPLLAIPGRVPEPWAMPPGCAFAPRCSRRIDRCDAGVPDLASVAPGRRAACIRAEAA